MRALIVSLTALGALLTGPMTTEGDAQVTLAWSPPFDPTVAGYYFCWGTSSGNYTFTNTYPNTWTNAVLSNLVANQTYYCAVAAFNANGLVSAFSSEVSFVNDPPSTNNPVSTNGPPSPLGTNPPITGPITNPPGTNSVGNGTNIAVNIWGIPPFLTLMLSNGQPNLSIGGTVGATVIIEATTNLFSLDSWETVTNISITNIASVTQSNQSQGQDVLGWAFVPGSQALPISLSNSTPFQFFRVVMPYDYVILASTVLPGKGYTPRLILVNMPGIVADDACYVNESSSFIHYNRGSYALQLESSASTIREIAATLANSFNLNWTSASEFTYSNGLGQILATVVETEPPSSDPVAGQNPPSQPMVIDF